ncbi:MAG TPA: biotin/lipoyl-binding protein, partial [Reyranella sp.]
MLLLFILWETFTFFVAYTDDAYVRSDLVAVAPEVTGRIIAVHVVDNQTVKKGDKLVSIDPVPFQLDVNTRQAQIDEAASLLKVAQEQLATANEALIAA